MKTDVIEVGGVRYSLKKMTPDAGSFIYLKLMGALLLDQSTAAHQEEPEESTEDKPKPSPRERAKLFCSLAFMRGLSYEHAQFAQKTAMMCVSRVDETSAGEIILPVMNDRGVWVTNPNGTSMTDDLSLVHRLTIESLAFSLESFFVEKTAA